MHAWGCACGLGSRSCFNVLLSGSPKLSLYFVHLCVSSSAEHECFCVHCFFCGYVVFPCFVLASALWVNCVCCAMVVVCFSVCACFYCCDSFYVASWLLSFHGCCWLLLKLAGRGCVVSPFLCGRVFPCLSVVSLSHFVVFATVFLHFMLTFGYHVFSFPIWVFARACVLCACVRVSCVFAWN